MTPRTQSKSRLCGEKGRCWSCACVHVSGSERGSVRRAWSQALLDKNTQRVSRSVGFTFVGVDTDRVPPDWSMHSLPPPPPLEIMRTLHLRRNPLLLLIFVFFVLCVHDGVQRVIHGGVIPGETKTWTLCNSQQEEDFKPLKPSDSPFILMVDRGECTFASKVCIDCAALCCAVLCRWCVRAPWGSREPHALLSARSCIFEFVSVRECGREQRESEYTGCLCDVTRKRLDATLSKVRGYMCGVLSWKKKCALVGACAGCCVMNPSLEARAAR